MATVTGRQLADKALDQARQCLAEHLSGLAADAADDLDVLRAAAEVLRVTDRGRPAIERTVQHMAFTFVTALYAEAVGNPHG